MTANVADLMAAFEAGTLDPAAFRHADHVQLAWAHLRHDAPPRALDRFCAGLRRLAAAAGKPERYHETITWAFLLLINERMERTGRELDWDEFARRNPDLLRWRPSILEDYYPPDVLASDLARRVFVLPRPSPLVG
jgi:hypothetical protein